MAVTGSPFDHAPDLDEDTAAQAILAADAARVRALVAQLPADQRAVICMHFGIGRPPMGFRELSRRMGISVGYAFKLERIALVALRRDF